MANITDNRINTTLSTDQVSDFGTAITDANTALDGSTVGLIADERKTMFSLDVANKEFAQDCLAQGVALNALLPVGLQIMVGNLQKDLGLNAQLEQIENAQLAPLALRVSDTRRLTAHEAYAVALAIYKFIEAMATTGIEGYQAAYEVLKKRFEGQGGSAPAENP